MCICTCLYTWNLQKVHGNVYYQKIMHEVQKCLCQNKLVCHSIFHELLEFLSYIYLQLCSISLKYPAGTKLLGEYFSHKF